MDAGRRHEDIRLQGQRKDFIALAQQAAWAFRIFALLLCSQAPQGQGNMTQRNATHAVRLHGRGTLALGIHRFITISKRAYSLSWTGTWHLPWKSLAVNTILRDSPGRGWPVPFILGIPSKNRKGCLRPMRDCLSQQVMFQKINDSAENTIKNQIW